MATNLNSFPALLQWFGNDQSFKFPMYAEESLIQNTRPTYVTPPSATKFRGLAFTTRGGIGRLPQFWKRRCKFTINKDGVSGRHAVLRVLVTADVMPSEVLDPTSADCAGAAGGDIKFSMDVDGMYEIPCEIVTVTQDATPANQRAEIWVLVPNVDSVNGGEFYMWWKGVDADAPVSRYATPTLNNKLLVWEFFKDYREGCHGPHPTTAAPKGFRVAQTNAQTAWTGANITAGADQWGGNGAFYFAPGATSRYVRQNLSAYNGPPEGTSMTQDGFISMWFKKDADNFAGNKYLFSFGDATAASGAKCYARFQSDTVYFYVVDGGGTVRSMIALYTLADTNWHHICCAWMVGDQDNVTLEVYLDGKLRANSVVDQAFARQLTANQYLSIGNPYNSTTEHWEGYIDEFRYGTFPLPGGLPATEYATQKASWRPTMLTSAAPTTPTIPAQPYTTGTRQYLMIGPKGNETMPTRYKSKFTPLTPYAVTTLSTGYPYSATDVTYDASKDIIGNLGMFVKYTPTVARKGFLIWRARYPNNEYGGYYPASEPMSMLNYAKDPGYASCVEAMRGVATSGYGKYDYYGYYSPPREYDCGLAYMEHGANDPQYLWFKLGTLDPGGSMYPSMLHLGWIDLPTASSPGSPNEIAFQYSYSTANEYVDETLANGYGSTKELFLKFTPTDPDGRAAHFWSAYQELFTLTYYGTDSTFTTPVSTTSNVSAADIGIAASPGDTYYFKVTPANPRRRLILQAIYGD